MGKLENKRKYQSYEQNSDFDLNTYETFYRMHDPQIGRWWQIYPKPESAIQFSPYVSMNNNPISIIDPLGDVVRYERGEGVSRKEFREFKREIRQMRRNSESFNTVYKGFKNDNRTFKYVATNTSSGGVTDKTKMGYDMRISLHAKDPNQGGNEKFSRVSQVAHETGHAFRKSNNLDPSDPGKLPSLIGMNIDQRTETLNNHTSQVVNYNQTKELGASHIENIVISELIKSRSNFFTGIKLSETYFGGLTSKMTISNGRILDVLEVSNLNKLQAPRTSEYYLGNTFNIYTEHGLPEPDN